MKRVDMVVLAGLLLTLATTVYGSTDAGHAEGDSDAWFMLACTFVNFTIFVLLMRRFTRLPLRDYLVGRRKQVVEEMAAASKARAEAEALRREYEEKLAGLEEARRALIDEVESIARGDRERALVAARETGERLARDAARRAHFELEQARRELRAEAARLAADIAARGLVERVAAQEQQSLLRDFLDKVRAS